MSLPWFRLYAELLDDPKIGSLSDAEFRCFIESLCWACKRGDDGRMGLNVEAAQWAFRRNVSDTLQSLVGKRLLTLRSDGELVVTSWNKRQMKSDKAAERVARHRESKKHNMKRYSNGDVTADVTLQKRYSNGLEENRREEKREEKNTSAIAVACDFEAFWETYPRKVGKLAAQRAWAKADLPAFDVIVKAIDDQSRGEQWRKEGGAFIPHPATWINEGRWLDQPAPAATPKKGGAIYDD